MKKLSWMLAACALAAAMVGSPAFCQDKPSDNMQIVIEKVRADKKLLVAENMQLTENEARAFWPVYKQYQDELFLLRSRAASMIKGYSDAYGAMTNEKAKKLMDCRPGFRNSVTPYSS